MELIIAMGMAMVVLAGTIVVFSTSNQAYVKQDLVVSAEQNVRSTMEIMSHELRMAGYIPMTFLSGEPDEITADVSSQGWSNGVLDRIEYASETNLTFVADTNADGILETITYALDGNTLLRKSWDWDNTARTWVSRTSGTDEVVVLAENISSLQFVYTFENGGQGQPNEADATTTNDRDDIRAVTIALTGSTRAPVTGDTYGNRRLQSYVQMRNMGLETSTH
jgi:type II secretory pathway component PulJ